MNLLSPDPALQNNALFSSPVMISSGTKPRLRDSVHEAFFVPEKNLPSFILFSGFLAFSLWTRKWDTLS